MDRVQVPTTKTQKGHNFLARQTLSQLRVALPVTRIERMPVAQMSHGVSVRLKGALKAAFYRDRGRLFFFSSNFMTLASTR